MNAKLFIWFNKKRRCVQKHTHIFTGVTDDTTAMESFLLNRFTLGHACRTKAVNLWGLKCGFVLFIHQEILIHKFDFLLCQHKGRNLSWPVQLVVNYHAISQVELSPKRHHWQLLPLLLLTFMLCSSSLSGHLIVVEIMVENFWSLLSYFLQGATVMNIQTKFPVHLTTDSGKKGELLHLTKWCLILSFLSLEGGFHGITQNSPHLHFYSQFYKFQNLRVY